MLPSYKKQLKAALVIQGLFITSYKEDGKNTGNCMAHFSKATENVCYCIYIKYKCPVGFLLFNVSFKK